MNAEANTGLGTFLCHNFWPYNGLNKNKANDNPNKGVLLRLLDQNRTNKTTEIQWHSSCISTYIKTIYRREIMIIMTIYQAYTKQKHSCCIYKKLYGPFLWMEFNCLKATGPLWGGSLPLSSTKILVLIWST